MQPCRARRSCKLVRTQPLLTHRSIIGYGHNFACCSLESGDERLSFDFLLIGPRNHDHCIAHERRSALITRRKSLQEKTPRLRMIRTRCSGDHDLIGVMADIKQDCIPGLCQVEVAGSVA